MIAPPVPGTAAMLYLNVYLLASAADGDEVRIRT